MNKEQLEELLNIIRNIAIEQATREFSGELWLKDILTRIDKIPPTK